MIKKNNDQTYVENSNELALKTFLQKTGIHFLGVGGRERSIFGFVCSCF